MDREHSPAERPIGRVGRATASQGTVRNEMEPLVALAVDTGGLGGLAYRHGVQKRAGTSVGGQP